MSGKSGVRSGFRVAALGVGLLGFAALAIAADQIRTERVNFARGASSAVVKGRITGYETVDYVLGAAKGQRMSVSMKTDTDSNYFNLLAPGESEVAFFNSSTDGNRYEGVLPASGDFKIRVYLMRSDARRNKTANYTLQVAITGAPQGVAAGGAAHAGGASREGSVQRASRGQFDATSQVPCAQARGQPMGSCALGVARDGGGTATVVVTRPDGRKRMIFFDKGTATGADTSQADGDVAFRARKESDLNFIEIGPERYEIPDAVVSGG